MNLQNIPRTDLVVKSAFLPKLDTLVFADYSGIEYCLLGYFVSGLGDDSLASEFRAGFDPHVATAKILFDKEDITDAERQSAKTFNYSVIYGAGPDKIAYELGCNKKQAITYHRNFHKARPGIRALQDEISDTLDYRGYLRTPWGRPLHCKNNHAASNALIQGTAADLLRDAMRKTAGWLAGAEYRSHMILSVHDELGLDCALDEEEAIIEALPILMNDEEIGEIVPINVDIKRSTTNWAEAQEL